MLRILEDGEHNSNTNCYWGVIVIRNRGGKRKTGIPQCLHTYFSLVVITM